MATCRSSSSNEHVGRPRRVLRPGESVGSAGCYGVATLILRDQDRAQDAVQEALVLAWRDVRALRDPDAWDAWLYRLTVRACYRVARTQRRRNVVELHVVPDREPATEPTSR